MKPESMLIGHGNKLSKDEEAATGTEDTEVRREDQDKINRFSRLHQRETVLEERLKAKQVCPVSFPRTICHGAYV